jgi:hypothetical protein
MRLTDIVILYVGYTAALAMLTAVIVLSVWGVRRRHQ